MSLWQIQQAVVSCCSIVTRFDVESRLCIEAMKMIPTLEMKRAPENEKKNERNKK
jgi:hypothetical protein